MKLSAEQLGPKGLTKVTDSGEFDYVHLPCISTIDHQLDVVDEMGLSEGAEAPLLHIPINRIENLPRLVTALKKRNVSKILLVSGSPVYGKPWYRMNELITYFAAEGIEVSTGAYAEGYFSLDSDARAQKAIDVTREKVSHGATRVVVQAPYNLAAMERWFDLREQTNLDVPVYLAVMPPLDPTMVSDVVKKRIRDGVKNLRWLGKVEMDFGYRLVRSSRTDVAMHVQKILEEGFLREDDGFHIVATRKANPVSVAEDIRRVHSGLKGRQLESAAE